MKCVIIIAIMQVVSKGENSRRLTRQRTDLELPKISKTTSVQCGTYQNRYEWVTRSSQYLLLSNNDVQEEHKYLQAQLSLIQDQYIKLNEIGSNSNVKPLRKSHQTNLLQNRERQIQNNNAIIWKMRNQLDLLQRQAGPGSKESPQLMILQVRQKIAKTKQKIKEIKQKSREISGTFQNGQDIFEEIKKLENERDGLQFKKIKAEEKLIASTANFERLMSKLTDIEEECFQAQKFLEDHYQNERTDAAERSMQNQLKQKMYQFQIIRKTTQSQKGTKQQKYHQLLKALETQMEKYQLLQKKANNLEVKQLYQRKQIIELEQTLNQLEMAANERSRTSGSVEARPTTLQDQIIQTQDYNRNKAQLAEIRQIRYRKLQLQPRKKGHNSRTKTSSGNYDYKKANQTEIFNKPLGFENEQGDMTRMVSQPFPNNRGYFRTSRSKLTSNSENNSKKLIMGVRNQIQQTGHITEEIQQQSPDKQTIDKTALQNNGNKQNSQQINQETAFDNVNINPSLLTKLETDKQQKQPTKEQDSNAKNQFINIETKIQDPTKQQEIIIDGKGQSQKQIKVQSDVLQQKSINPPEFKKVEIKTTAFKQQQQLIVPVSTAGDPMKQKRSIIANYVNQFEEEEAQQQSLK